jgi:hypothetical protein
LQEYRRRLHTHDSGFGNQRFVWSLAFGFAAISIDTPRCQGGKATDDSDDNQQGKKCAYQDNSISVATLDPKRG